MNGQRCLRVEQGVDIDFGIVGNEFDIDLAQIEQLFLGGKAVNKKLSVLQRRSFEGEGDVLILIEDRPCLRLRS